MSASTPDRSEGFIDVGPGRVWYESRGHGPALLLLHGGPGASSDYLVPFLDFAGQGYRVVRYDQLGSRRSDHPIDASLFSVDRFAEEVEIVRRELGLGQVHLLGQSWGAFLALEYALRYQQNLKSLVLYSGTASTLQCVAGMDTLRYQLPTETIEMMAECEANGDVENPLYVDVIALLYHRHLCRLDPYPPLMQESMAHIGRLVYETMWGPNEFTCTGTLREWDRTSRLGELSVPTLITCGRFDEVTPDNSITLHEGISGSELVIFESSSHSAHFEEPDKYVEVLTAFLNRVSA